MLVHNNHHDMLANKSSNCKAKNRRYAITHTHTREGCAALKNCILCVCESSFFLALLQLFDNSEITFPFSLFLSPTCMQNNIEGKKWGWRWKRKRKKKLNEKEWKISKITQFQGMRISCAVYLTRYLRGCGNFINKNSSWRWIFFKTTKFAWGITVEVD